MILSQEQINRALRWYLRQPKAERVEVHREKIRLNKQRQANLRAQKLPDDDPAAGDYDSFVQAAHNRSRIHCDGLDNRRDLEEVTAIRIKTVKATKKDRSSPVKDKLTGKLYKVVLRLQAEGLSWAKISDYLAKYHKRRISRSYLCDTFSTSAKPTK
jgi:hypothetical protein